MSSAQRSTSGVYDVIVVGAGIVGSATAYHLAKNSNNTLLIDQFPLPHSRGSSHGQSRITRKAYNQTYYAAMMDEAYKKWEELEQETKTELYQKTGMLVVGPDGSKHMVGTEHALQSIGATYQTLDNTQLGKQYPQLVFDSKSVGLVDPDAGILKADKCLQGMQSMYIKYGGTLCENTKVERIVPGEIVTIHTNRGQYQAKSIVIAAGPWASNLLKPLGIHIPLKPVRIAACYWNEKNPGQYSISENFPVLLVFPNEEREADFYALPAGEYPNCFKLCMHLGPEIDPNHRDYDTKSTWDIDGVRRFVSKHCPGLENKPSIVEKCIYTMTPDEDFVLDTHPHWNNVVIGCGFSGHGFKMSPVTGQILGELATGKKPSYDLKPFKMDRFHNKAKL